MNRQSFKAAGTELSVNPLKPLIILFVLLAFFLLAALAVAEVVFKKTLSWLAPN